MECQRCGLSNAEAARFCPGCGNALSAAASVMHTERPGPGETMASVQHPPPLQPSAPPRPSQRAAPPYPPYQHYPYPGPHQPPHGGPTAPPPPNNEDAGQESNRPNPPANG